MDIQTKAHVTASEERMSHILPGIFALKTQLIEFSWLKVLFLFEVLANLLLCH